MTGAQRRTLALVALLVLVVAGVGVPVTATATTAPGICDGVEGDNVVVARFPAPGSATVSTSTSVYAGSTLELAVCSRGQPEPVGSAWSLADSDGLSVDDRSDQTVTVTVTQATDEIVLDASAIDGKQQVQSLAVEVVLPASTESTFGDRTVRFASRDALDTYEAQEDRYIDATDAVESARKQVANATAAPVAPVNPQTIERLQANVRALESATDAVAWTLAANASRTGDDAGLAAAATARARTSNTTADVTTALTEYAEAANSRADAILLRTVGSVLLALVPGLLVGGVLGVLNPRRHWQNASYDKQFVETTIETRVAYPALVVGAVLVIVGLGVAAWSGGLGHLIEVLL